MLFFAKVRFIVTGVALAITAVMPSSALAASTETIVSLTFDDGLAGQQFAADALTARGMSGTFYVNSSNIGHAGWLTWDQVEAMQVAGHEIGGHTRNHRVVGDLMPAELVSEICGDRAALTAHELRITSFAYPEGAFTADAADVLHGCGYRSARTVGGLKSGTLCGSCPAVEPAPPADLFAVRTPSTGAGERTSLADLQGYVEAAEQDATPGAGWIPIVFHEICAGTAEDPCSGLYVTQADLVTFLDWLNARSQRPVPTVVRSVDEVVHGRSASLPALAAPA